MKCFFLHCIEAKIGVTNVAVTCDRGQIQGAVKLIWYKREEVSSSDFEQFKLCATTSERLDIWGYNSKMLCGKSSLPRLTSTSTLRFRHAGPSFEVMSPTICKNRSFYRAVCANLQPNARNTSKSQCKAQYKTQARARSRTVKLPSHRH